MEKFKRYTNKIIFFALFLICVTFPFSFKISNIAVALLVIAWLSRKIVLKEKVQFKVVGKTARYCVFAFLGLFALQALSLLYTENIGLGVKFLEYKLSFLILPLIIADLDLSKKQIVNQLKYFTYSIVAISTFLIVNSFINYFNHGELLTYHAFSETNTVLEVHAVFYSYYIYLTILILAYLYSSNESTIKSIFIPLLALPLIVALVFAASKNVMVITFLSVLLYFVFTIIKKIKWKEIVIIAVSLILAVFLIGKIPIIKERIAELKDLSGIENLEKVTNREWLTAEERELFNGTSLRLAFWYIGCSEVLDNNRLLIGLSPGDSKALINERYDELNLLPHFENFNMHNQYLQFFVEFGIIGLALYLIFISLLLLAGVKNKNPLLTVFVFGFMFFQLTESLLERNKGILFFVFFLLLLLKLNTNSINEDSNIRDKGNT